MISSYTQPINFQWIFSEKNRKRLEKIKWVEVQINQTSDLNITYFWPKQFFPNLHFFSILEQLGLHLHLKTVFFPSFWPFLLVWVVSVCKCVYLGILMKSWGSWGSLSLSHVCKVVFLHSITQIQRVVSKDRADQANHHDRGRRNKCRTLSRQPNLMFPKLCQSKSLLHKSAYPKLCAAMPWGITTNSQFHWIF